MFFSVESAFSENSDKIRRLQYYIIVNFFAEKYDKDDKESLECEKCQGFDFEICRSYAIGIKALLNITRKWSS
jgi:hypothetical protein